MDVVGGEAYSSREHGTHAATTGHRGADSRRETGKRRFSFEVSFARTYSYFLTVRIRTFIAQALDSVVLPIVNKPKPKAEPPKEEKAKDKDADEQKMNNQNSQANAHNHTNQQTEQEEKMDVE